MSICPICNRKVPVERYAENGGIYDVKICPEHGKFKSIIWQGEPAYEEWISPGSNTKPFRANTQTEAGCPFDCGICPDHEQEACCVLIELTRRCNQHCPYCYADSSKTEGETGPEPGSKTASEENKSAEIYEDDPTLEEIHDIYSFLLEQSPGRPFNIQLSGGEPTIRDDLPQIVEIGRKMGFPYIQLNTNGKRLAEDRPYVKALKEAGLSSVFMQFDGLSDHIYFKTRGQKLLRIKEQAIENCAEEDLGVVLVMTVVPKVNDHKVGDIIKFAVERRPHVRGIHFQPVSYFGRFPAAPADEDRITIPQLIRAIESQTNGAIRRESFVPLATGHPLCSFHGNFLVQEDGSLTPLSNRENAGGNTCCCSKTNSIVRARDYIARKWSWDGGAIHSNSGENDVYDLSDWDQLIQNMQRNSFSLTAMAFQDAWNLDLERLRRCRVHVATKDRKLIPFCSYNILHRDSERQKDKQQRR